MNTYNLISVELYGKRGDDDCFCALGVYLAEKGHSVDAIRTTQYFLFNDEYDDELARLGAALGLPPLGLLDMAYAPIYRANDSYEYNKETKEKTYHYTAERFEEAFRAIGMDVKLIDRRNEPWQQTKASDATSTLSEQ